MTRQTRARLNRALVVTGGALVLTAGLLLLLGGLAEPAARATPAQAAPLAGGGLQVEKIGPLTARAGQPITFTLLITNASGQTLNGVILTDTWSCCPYSGTYQVGGGISVNSVIFSRSVSYIQFNLAPLAIGATGRITLSTVVSPTCQPNYDVGPTLVGNTALITTSTPGVTSTNDTIWTTIIGPVLRLTKTFTPTNPRPGRLLTFTFALENKNRLDALPATGIIITEDIPLNTIYYAAYPASLATYSPPRRVQWILTKTLPVSSTTYVTLTVRVTPTKAYAGDLLNAKTACGVRVAELPNTVACYKDVRVKVDDVFEKVAKTLSPPVQTGTISRTFPNRILTYTVYVYNPFPAATGGLLLTDTLPNNPTPLQTFQYSGTLAWGPPGPPTLTLYSPPVVVWRLPTIQPWGLYTFSFRAFVPPHIKLDDNKQDQGTKYYNKLAGRSGSLALPTNDGHHDDPMTVIVVPQIKVGKSVSPRQQTYGSPVTYTLSITNTGLTTVTGIAITDVLPCAFQWLTVLSGPPPTVISGTTVVWRGITLAGSASWSVSFTVLAQGCTGSLIYNTVEGTSPDTTIVRQTRLAPLTVGEPIQFHKTVAPASVVLGGVVYYTARGYNVTGVDAVMNGFTDTLPTGFFAPGYSPVYTDMTGMPFTLQANHQNEYVTTFPVTVAYTLDCDKLPKTIPQEPLTFGTVITEPPELVGFWGNKSKEAYLKVYPQAQVVKLASPPGAAPGEALTFTIVLSNNTGADLSNVTVTDNMPVGFLYGGVLPGTPVPNSTVPNVVWVSQTIPAGGRITLAFTATAPLATGKYTNYVKAVKADDPLICIPAYQKDVWVNYRRVQVGKIAAPGTVDPGGLFSYTISLLNKGPYTVTLARFTDTLPGFPGDKWSFVSMRPGDMTPVSTNPPVWVDLTLPPNTSTPRYLRFTVRTGASFDTYKNVLVNPRPQDGQMAAVLPTDWEITTTKPFYGAPVTVRPALVLSKSVTPTQAFPGATVVYTVTLSNQSTKRVENLYVTDTLPAGFTFVAMVSGQSPQATNPPMWSLGSMQPGELREMVFRARVGNVAPGVYYNRLDARSTTYLIPSTGDVAPVTVLSSPTGTASKSVAPTSVGAGGEIVYTLNLTNPNPAAVSLRITDTLPAGFSFVGMVSGPAPALTAPQVVWNDFELPAGAAAQLVFRARAPADASGTYYNQLDSATMVGAAFAGTGPTAPVVVTTLASLELVKKVDKASVAGGEEVVYTLNLRNSSPDQTVTARITDTLPDYIRFVAMTTGPAPVQTSPQVVWDGIAVGPESIVQLVFRAQVASNAPAGTYYNQLDGVSTQGKHFSTGPVAPVTVEGKLVNLSKSVAPSAVSPGSDVTYTLYLANLAGQPVTARITDTLPNNFSFVGMVSGPAPAVASPQVVWAGVSIPAQSTVKLVFRAHVASNAYYPKTYYNQLNGSAEGVTFNGSGPTAPVTVVEASAIADVQVTKSDGASTSNPGDTVVYTIRYTNTSPNLVNDAVLTDTWAPAGYLTAYAPGWTIVAPGVYRRLVDLAPHASGSVTLALTIDPNIPTDYLIISNTARIAPGAGMADPTPSNNTATDINTIRGPDIAVTGLSVSAPANLRQGDTLTVTVTLQNVGNSATSGPGGTGWFGADLYIKPAGEPPPSNPGDRYLGVCPTHSDYCPQTARWSLHKYVKVFGGDGLAPGESHTLTYVYVLPTGGDLWLYVQADTFWGQNGDPDPTMYGASQTGRIVEGNEANNIYGPVEIHVQALRKMYLPIVIR